MTSIPTKPADPTTDTAPANLPSILPINRVYFRMNTPERPDHSDPGDCARCATELIAYSNRLERLQAIQDENDCSNSWDNCIELVIEEKEGIGSYLIEEGYVGTNADNLDTFGVIDGQDLLEDYTQTDEGHQAYLQSGLDIKEEHLKFYRVSALGYCLELIA